MKTYKIKVTYTFEGTVDVRADSKKEAKNIVDKGFGGAIADVGQSSWIANTKDEEGITMWDIPYHPTKTTIK